MYVCMYVCMYAYTAYSPTDLLPATAAISFGATLIHAGYATSRPQQLKSPAETIMCDSTCDSDPASERDSVGRGVGPVPAQMWKQ